MIFFNNSVQYKDNKSLKKDDINKITFFHAVESLTLIGNCKIHILKHLPKFLNSN